MKNSEVITKGTFARKVGFPIYVNRYLILSNPQHALVSFVNSSDYEVTEICFVIKQYDANDNLIVQKKEVYGLSILPEAEFKLDYSVDSECEKIDVEIESVYSNGYEYVSEGDRVLVKYCSEPQKSIVFTQAPNYTVTSKSKKIPIFVFVFVLIVFVIAFFMAILSGVFDDDINAAEFYSEFYSQVGEESC